MTKIHEIDGVKYREVDRKAEVGDTILITHFNDADTFAIRKVTKISREYDNDLYFEPLLDGDHYLDGDSERYCVLEPVTEVVGMGANERILNMIANLAKRVTELKREVTDLDEVYRTLVTEITEIDENVEMALDDIVTLDDRTQGLTEPIGNDELSDYMRGYADGINCVVTALVKGRR